MILESVIFKIKQKNIFFDQVPGLPVFKSNPLKKSVLNGKQDEMGIRDACKRKT